LTYFASSLTSTTARMAYNVVKVIIEVRTSAWETPGETA
jgi:hypothetical protein